MTTWTVAGVFVRVVTRQRTSELDRCENAANMGRTGGKTREEKGRGWLREQGELPTGRVQNARSYPHRDERLLTFFRLKTFFLFL